MSIVMRSVSDACGVLSMSGYTDQLYSALNSLFKTIPQKGIYLIQPQAYYVGLIVSAIGFYLETESPLIRLPRILLPFLQSLILFPA